MKAFIFDMDGTLIDNMSYHFRAWQTVLAAREMHVPLAEIPDRAYGKNNESFERFLGRKPDKEEILAFNLEKEQAYRDIYAPFLSLIEGVEPFLKAAKALGIPMAIGTGASVRNTNFVVDGLNIRQYFSQIITAEDVTNGKPHPETFLSAAVALGVKPENCVVFEDVLSGAEAAERAGMKTVILTTTFAHEEVSKYPSVIKVINDYTEIQATDFLV